MGLDSVELVMAVDEGVIWERLREVVVRQLGVRPEEVTLTAQFVQDQRVA